MEGREAWVEEHRCDWNLIQTKSLKYEHIELDWFPAKGGSIHIGGFTYDEKAKEFADEFVRKRIPSDYNFVNSISVHSKEDFDEILERRRDLVNK